MKPKALAPKKPLLRLSLGGHISFTVLVVSLTLFIAGSVYFVNTVVLTTGTDPTYRQTALANAQLTNFNADLLKQAQDFSANANNTALPAGRYDPFTP